MCIRDRFRSGLQIAISVSTCQDPVHVRLHRRCHSPSGHYGGGSPFHCEALFHARLGRQGEGGAAVVLVYGRSYDCTVVAAETKLRKWPKRPWRKLLRMVAGTWMWTSEATAIPAPLA